MKNIFNILMLFVFTSAAISSENNIVYSVTPHQETFQAPQTPQNNHLKGLTKATSKELSTQKIMLDGESIAVYTVEGKRVRGMEMMQFFTSGEYSPEFYMNKNKEIKVAVLRPSTEEEKAQMKITTNRRNTETDLIGSDAFPFSATDMNGNKYSLDDLKGKIIVMNFWFVECKPCIMEMPELNEIVELYKNNKDVVFLGFATNDTNKIKSFLQRKTFSYHIIPNSTSIARDYNVSSYPTHMIIGKDGKISYHTIGLGPNTISDLKRKIKKLLK